MSDTATQNDSGEQSTENENPNIKLLREKANKADEAEAALAASRRENAMLRSGIDLESPLGDFFVKSYTGDPADVDALKAEATRLGVPFKGAPVEAPSGETEEPAEPTGTEQRSALSDGAPADTGEDTDPRQTAKEHFDRRMSEGAPQEDAAGEALNILANAAQRGDPRVIVNG